MLSILPERKATVRIYLSRRAGAEGQGQGGYRARAPRARRGESRDAAPPGATHRTQCLERHNFERIPSCTDRDSRAAAHTPHAHWHIHKHPMQGFRHSLIISHIQCSADYGRSANHEYRRPRTVTAYRARSRTPVAPPHHATTRIYLSTPSRACAKCADVHMRSRRPISARRARAPGAPKDLRDPARRLSFTPPGS